MSKLTISLIVAVLYLTMSGTPQKLCQNCWQGTIVPTQFLCNGRNCQAFNAFNNNYSFCNFHVDCYKNTSTSSCYALKINDPGLCVACNYTYPNCIRCYETIYRQGCYQCDSGYYRYISDMKSQVRTCRSCSASIAGCELCQYQGNCTQCKSEYRNIKGLCYNQDGSLVNDADSNVVAGWSAEGILIIVLLFLIVFGIGLVAFVVNKTGKKINQRSLLSEGEQA